MLAVGVTLALISAVMELEATVFAVLQATLLVKLQTTALLLFIEVVEKLLLVCPETGDPLMNHAYCGALPPLVGVALKVMLEPEHTLF